MAAFLGDQHKDTCRYTMQTIMLTLTGPLTGSDNQPQVGENLND